MTELECIKGFARREGRRQKYLVNNLHFYQWESDIIVQTMSGYLQEIEVKVSRADFLADRKKAFLSQNPVTKQFEKIPKYDLLQKGLGPYRFAYLIPAELLDQVKSEIPSWVGLYTVRSYYSGDFTTYSINKIKTGKKLHNNKATEAETKALLLAAYYKNFNKLLK